MCHQLLSSSVQLFYTSEVLLCVHTRTNSYTSFSLTLGLAESLVLHSAESLVWHWFLCSYFAFWVPQKSFSVCTHLSSPTHLSHLHTVCLAKSLVLRLTDSLVRHCFVRIVFHVKLSQKSFLCAHIDPVLRISLTYVHTVCLVCCV